MRISLLAGIALFFGIADAHIDAKATLIESIRRFEEGRGTTNLVSYQQMASERGYPDGHVWSACREDGELDFGDDCCAGFGTGSCADGYDYV